MTACTHRLAQAMTGKCASCEDAEHAEQHPVPVDGCFACKLSTLQWSPAAHPSTYNKIPPRVPANTWERGIVTSARPDGTEMPILDRNLKQIGVKELTTRRSEVESGLRALHNS